MANLNLDPSWAFFCSRAVEKALAGDPCHIHLEELSGFQVPPKVDYIVDVMEAVSRLVGLRADVRAYLDLPLETCDALELGAPHSLGAALSQCGSEVQRACVGIQRIDPQGEMLVFSGGTLHCEELVEFELPRLSRSWCARYVCTTHGRGMEPPLYFRSLLLVVEE